MLLLVGIFITDDELLVNVTWIFFKLISGRFINFFQLYILVFVISSLWKNSSRTAAPNGGIQVGQ